MNSIQKQTKNASAIVFVLGIACVTACILLNGCGQGPQGPMGQEGPQGPTPTSPVDPAIQAIVNEYPTQINPGINCTVQQVTAGQWISASSPGYNAGQGTLVLAGSARPYTLTAGFNQANASSGANSVVAADYQYLLSAWVNYKVVCSGYLVLTQAGIYDFDLNSDDGSILSLSGLGSSYSLNNDGNHSMTEKATTTGSYLYPGVYSINVQYAQSGGGNFGMILSYFVDGNESVVPAANFYH